MANCSPKELVTARAVKLNITAKRNDTFNPNMTLLENGVPFDFSDYDIANMQVKSRQDSSVILLLSIANTRITLGGSLGTITFSVAKETMNIPAGVYVYDLEITSTSTGARETVLEGLFTVEEDITVV